LVTLSDTICVTNMDAYTFGTWLRQRRRTFDWTQADLARRVNCTAAMIRKLEADERRPSPQLAEWLAEALRIPTAERAAFLQAARHTGGVEQLLKLDLPLPTGRTPHNLLAPLTSFINRVNDGAAVVDLLTRDEVRLVTLIGPPGIGKTRLCLRSAENVIDHYPGGVWFVDLGSLTQPDQVLPTIARTLQIAESGAHVPLEQIRQAIGDQRVLLALDNFEQVSDAAPAVSELLKASKNLKVLATSRAPLHVYGEHEYALPSLSVPPRGLPPAQLIAYESAQLFLARVQEHQPRFVITSDNAADVTEVCIHLDGVPLAIELAAASLRRMTLKQLVVVLTGEAYWLAALQTPARDLPSRQRTLYNAIAWSYSLLDSAAQFVFRHLGVTVGGFDASAATAICSLDRDRVDAALAELRDHNLLVRDHDRWRMLEMIRESGLEQLTADEIAAAQQRHTQYFAARLQALSSESSAQIEIDHDNYRAALRWAVRKHDGLLALTICSALTDFWETRGYLREGLAWAREVLAIAENVEPVLRIELLGSAGHLAWNRHEFDAALDLTEQGITLARENALGEYLAFMLGILGRIYIEHGSYLNAEQALQESLQLSQKMQLTDHFARARIQLGEVALACGRFDEAQHFSEGGLALLGDQLLRFVAMAHTNLAEVALARDNHALAYAELQHVLPYVHEHIRRELCFLITLAGWYITKPRARQTDVRRGVELLGMAAGLTDRTGAPPSAFYRTLIETRNTIAQQRLPAHDWQAAWSRGRAMGLEQSSDYARLLTVIARRLEATRK
jgi:predicted ATPase/transcriptional regulator with XRE-family HTH domain